MVTISRQGNAETKPCITFMRNMIPAAENMQKWQMQLGLLGTTGAQRDARHRPLTDPDVVHRHPISPSLHGTLRNGGKPPPSLPSWPD
jgi:hypothetical protein